MNIRRLVATIGLLAVVVPAWTFLAPPSLGGRTVYSSVNGSSMHPLLTTGDLAVLRPSTSYGVGDVVAYRSSAGDAVMMHRIVSVRDGRFTLKGDANGWLDADTPSAAQIVGKMWFSVPHVGGLIGGRAPVIFGLALAALVAFAGRFSRRKRARAPVSASVAPPPTAQVPAAAPTLAAAPEGMQPGDVGLPASQDDDGTSGGPRSDDRVGVAVAAALALAFLMLGIGSLVRPEGAQTRTLSYTHAGSFSYGASVPRGAAYADGTVSPGEPVFLRLVDTLDVSFEYEVRAETPADLAGTIALSAEIRDEGSRWARTFRLGRVQPITGSAATATAPLDVAVLRQLVERVEATTGLAPPHYLVSIRADVVAVGSIAGAPLQARFSASLPFTMNDLTLLPSVTTAAGQAPASAPEFNVSGAGSVHVPAAGPSVGPFGIRTGALRAAAAAGTAFFLMMAIGSLARLRRAHRRAGGISRRLERLVIEARAPQAPPWRSESPAMVVASMDDLAWIAEQGARPILHDATATADVYEVRDGDIVYRFERARDEIHDIA